MDVDIRWRLQRAWGLCGRHAWGALATETDKDRAVLISAVGWCSGWGPWITFTREGNCE